MKKPLISLLFIVLTVNYCEAQWVTIPDANFVQWLKNNGFAGCMNGNQMDTTCNAIINATVVDCHSKGIGDLTGIRYFDNLDSLNCSLSGLGSPVLPPSLKSLNCYGDALSNLPVLPASLKHLYCGANYITSFPSLPLLTILNCSNNSLNSLPALPTSLITLNCSTNFLKSLPALPSSLTYLDCNSNVGMESLPALPVSLIKLNCSDLISLASLPKLPSTLKWLDCSLNGTLENLQALPTTLTYLNCASTGLGSSGLPTLPAGLDTLYCEYVYLTSLPPLPTSLYFLNCSNNPDLACFPPLGQFNGSSTNSFNIYGTQIKCLPDSIKHPNIVSLPAIDTMRICNVSYNPNSCELVSGILPVSGSDLLKIYPNPAIDQLILIIGQLAKYKIDVSDNLGRVIITETIQENKSQLNINSLAKGIYFVHVYSSDVNEITKFVKE